MNKEEMSKLKRSYAISQKCGAHSSCLVLCSSLKQWLFGGKPYPQTQKRPCGWPYLHLEGSNSPCNF